MLAHATNGSIDLLLKSYGLVGVFIMVLITAVVFLWLDNKSLRKQNSDLQEKRITEGRESLTAINANTNALNNLSQLISLLRHG